jgi:hypothetical protein
VAKDKGSDDKAKPPKRARVLGPGTVAKPALCGAAVLAVVQLALK